MCVQPRIAKVRCRALAFAALSSLLFAAGCGGSGAVSTNIAPVTYTIGGTVSGLSGTGLVLQDNGGNNLAIGANGGFTFTAPIASGGTYNVTVLTQPSNPAQTCVVTSGSGTASANVTSVQVTCTTTNAYTVGGTISGLSGTGLVLQDNGGDNLSISANGGFTFATAIANGGAYNVTVFTQPSNPTQTCVVTSGSGTGSANVTSVQVNCTTAGTTVSGTAAAGWPIAGVVYVKDSTGTEFGPWNIDNSGSYSVDVTSGVPPFILEASGTIGLESIFVHSVAFSADLGGNVNITPLTELALINAGAATTLYGQCTGPSNCVIPSQANVDAAQASIQSELANAFTAFGVPATDFRTTPFTTGAVAGQSPIDVLLDAIGFVANAMPNSFNIDANIPMASIAAGTVLGVLPPPTFSATGVPLTGPTVVLNPALNAADVAAATNSPKNVVATAGNMQVVISWSAIFGATSYDIYWATTPGVGPTNGTKIAGVSSPYTDSGLTNGTTYYYVVAANVAGQSYVSPVVSATPSEGPPLVSIAIAPTFNGTDFTIILNANVPEPFTITNTGPPDSRMNYLVADNSSLGGFLSIQPSPPCTAGVESVGSVSGTLPGGQSASVCVSVQPEFAAGTNWEILPSANPFMLSVYTPQANNYVKIPIPVYILEPIDINVTATGSEELDGTGTGFCLETDNPYVQAPPNQASCVTMLIGYTTPIPFNAAAGQSYAIGFGGSGYSYPPPTTTTGTDSTGNGFTCTVTSGDSGIFGPFMLPVEVDCELDGNAKSGAARPPSAAKRRKTAARSLP